MVHSRRRGLLGGIDPQIELPFAGQNVLLCLSMDTVHHDDLESVISEYHPRLVVDLRHAPRFDLPGGTSSRVRNLLWSDGKLLSDFPVEFYKMQNEHLRYDLHGIAREIVNHVAVAAVNLSGPILFLFQRPEHISLFMPYLVEVLSNMTGMRWEPISVEGVRSNRVHHGIGL